MVVVHGGVLDEGGAVECLACVLNDADVEDCSSRANGGLGGGGSDREDLGDGCHGGWAGFDFEVPGFFKGEGCSLDILGG